MTAMNTEHSMSTVSKRALLSSVAALAVFVPLSVSCASPEKIEADHRDDRTELRHEQSEEEAKMDRDHREERVDLNAQQARENVDIDARAAKNDATNEAEQARFVVDARESLAKLDARIAELRRRGKTVDQVALNARAAVATHIETCANDRTMSKEAWTVHHEELKAQLVVLDTQVKRLEA
jgi:hypothetical protein